MDKFYNNDLIKKVYHRKKRVRLFILCGIMSEEERKVSKEKKENSLNNEDPELTEKSDKKIKEKKEKKKKPDARLTKNLSSLSVPKNTRVL